MTITQITFGKLPAVRIASPDGAEAIVSLFGGHLMSWKSADGKQRLFMSAQSALDGSKALRGGVPVIFPQFAERGTGMRHGFARTATWRHTTGGMEGTVAYAMFELTHADLAPAVAEAWPHAFALRLRVALHEKELQLVLEAENTGDDALQFAAALHTYFQLGDGEEARIVGLEAAPLLIRDKIDRIYRHIGAPISLNGMRLEQQGFRDAVVWNPGPEDAKALADLGDEEWQRFVCIEPASVDPMPLYPGETWTARHVITA
jgi:glucose-6-phosphate 1-epimerase